MRAVPGSSVAVCLALFAVAGCSGTEDFTGLRCSPIDPCPRGYLCGADKRCALPEDIADAGTRDAAINDAAAFDTGADDAGPGDQGAVDIGADAGPADAGPSDQGVPDAGGPCDTQAIFPSAGWGVRYHEIGIGPMGEILVGDCVDVATAAGDFVQVDWQGDAPTPASPIDFVSVWRTRRSFAAGVYTFDVEHDDGLRVYVDGALVYDGWSMGPTTTDFETPYIEAGEHDVMLEHYDSTGFAALSVRFERGCTASALVGFPNGDFGVKYFASNGRTIDFEHCFGRGLAPWPLRLDYRVTPPAPVLVRGRTDDYAVVGTKLLPMRGLTRFDILNTDALSLRANGTLLYDADNGDSYQGSPVVAYLSGSASLEIEWVILSGGNPEVSIDDANVCDEATASPATGWSVRYYGSDNLGPPTNRTQVGLNFDDCLGVETLATDNIDFDGSPPFIDNFFMNPNAELWGAQYRGTRSLSTSMIYSVSHDDAFRMCAGAGLSGCTSNVLYESWLAPNVVTNASFPPLTPGTYDFLLEYVQDFGGQQLHFQVAFN